MEEKDLLKYDRKFDFDLKNITLTKVLGKGAFGDVLLGEATFLISGEAKTKVAVKRVKSPPKLKEITSLIMELKIMIYVGKHVNIVNILGVVHENLEKRKCVFINIYSISNT